MHRPSYRPTRPGNVGTATPICNTTISMSEAEKGSDISNASKTMWLVSAPMPQVAADHSAAQNQTRGRRSPSSPSSRRSKMFCKRPPRLSGR